MQINIYITYVAYMVYQFVCDYLNIIVSKVWLASSVFLFRNLYLLFLKSSNPRLDVSKLVLYYKLLSRPHGWQFGSFATITKWIFLYPIGRLKWWWNQTFVTIVSLWQTNKLDTYIYVYIIFSYTKQRKTSLISLNHPRTLLL